VLKISGGALPPEAAFIHSHSRGASSGLNPAIAINS